LQSGLWQKRQSIRIYAYIRRRCGYVESGKVSRRKVTAEQIQSLLPPIVLSLGAILPFLIASPPFAVQEKARVLLICLMTLVIWLGYWMAYAFGDRPFYSLELTGILVGFALVLLLLLFYAAQRPERQVVDQSGKAKVDESGSPIKQALIDRPIWLWVYLAALFTLSIAAAFYVCPKDRVIVEVELDPGIGTGAQVVRLAEDTGFDPVGLTFQKREMGAEFMLTKAEFEAVKKFLVDARLSDGSNKHLIADPKFKTELLKPGFGQHFRVRAHVPG
jgi:hypothetical protein